MALHAKAKAEAGYRFYALYDKISREDILAHAYAQCRSNKGAPGVDGQDFADIEAYGVARWLGELALALRQESYRPDPIRRVYIPKANGKLRPLGISTIRDRVCMTAAMLVLEPIFEADLPSEQYAYRAGRNAQQAVVEVEEHLFRGHPDVVDADLADYFGSIPHGDLMKSLARRVVDRRVLHLIKMWLECSAEETDDRGRKTRTTDARDKRRGIPQGSPISPLLANLYMRRFVLAWKKLGLEQRLGSRIVTYADDLVILCRRGNAEEALRQLREITLWRYYPQALELGEDPGAAWFLELWALAPTPAEAGKLSEKKAARVLGAHRIRRLCAADAVAILRRPALTVAPGAAEAAKAHITALAERVLLVNRQLKEVTRQIDKLVETLASPEPEPGQPIEQRDAAILYSLPGVGRIVLATLLTEGWSAIQARDYHALRTLTGVAPVTKRSGKSCRIEMRKACSGRLRTAVYHWARVATQHDARSKERYAALRGRGHSHGRALRGVAVRLLAVACAMLKARTVYDPGKLGSVRSKPKTA